MDCQEIKATESIRKRVSRLNRWLAEVGFDIQSTTFLLGDIVEIVADFLVPLENVWTTLPNRLRQKPCDCAGTTSRTFKSCGCWIWSAQHICTTHTIGESQTFEFTITISGVKNGIHWWIGIMSGETNDGLQITSTPSQQDPDVDSMKEIPKLSAILCSYLGSVRRFNQFGFDGPEYHLFDYRQRLDPISITVKIGNDVRARDMSSLENEPNEGAWIQFFCDKRQSPRMRGDLRISHARPFVQFRQSDGTSADWATATIHTSLL